MSKAGIKVNARESTMWPKGFNNAEPGPYKTRSARQRSNLARPCCSRVPTVSSQALDSIRFDSVESQTIPNVRKYYDRTRSCLQSIPTGHFPTLSSREDFGPPADHRWV